MTLLDLWFGEQSFLYMMYLIYIDGYTLDHWVSIVWMVCINGGLIGTVIIISIGWYDNRQFTRRYPRYNSRRGRLLRRLYGS